MNASFNKLTYPHLQYITLLLFSNSYIDSLSSVASALFCERYQSKAGTDTLLLFIFLLYHETETNHWN